MRNHILKETYQLRLLHYEAMMSRTNIFGAAIGAAVIYVSSGRIGSDLILASVVSLLCVAAVTLLRSHIVYRLLADTIRTLIESGHIYVEEAIKPEINREALLPKNKEAALSFDITLYAAFLATGLILLELWSPFVLNREFDIGSSVAAASFGFLFTASISLIPKYANFGNGNSSRLMRVWPLVPVVTGVAAYLILTWFEFPLFIGLCMVQLILICIALGVVWDFDRR